MSGQKPVTSDYSQRITWSFLIGIYLAVNAIRDLFLLVEGPDCAHMKTQFVQGNHDWLANLTNVSGFHRVANTGIHPSYMTRSREESITEILLRIASHAEVGGVLLTSMPMAYITGADYERLCRDVLNKTGRQVINVPGKSLSGDWADGYAESLFALARQINLPEVQKPLDPKKVAIIGYLYDRNEADHQANLEHLTDLLTRMGLQVVSIWLDGGYFSELSNVAEAGTLISLPYARKAANWLSRRTGAQVVETELPFGLTATQHWLQVIAKATGCDEQPVIEEELGKVLPSLEWVAPFVFQGRRFGYIGDPWLLPGINDTAALLGAKLTWAVLTNPKAQSAKSAKLLSPKTHVKIWPRARQLKDFLANLPVDANADVVVMNDAGVGIIDAPWVGLGFPSSFSHRLYRRPFFGFQGFLALVDSLADQIRRREIVLPKTAL